MLDEQDKDAGRRFKMVTKVDVPGHGALMAVGFSKDGFTGEIDSLAGI